MEFYSPLLTSIVLISIPLLLLIGWRGSPNSNDEPQHQAQGNVTKNFLKLLGVKFIIINQDSDLSKIKDLSFNEFSNITTDNFFNLFGKLN